MSRHSSTDPVTERERLENEDISITLPQSHQPGNDLMSRLLLKDSRVSTMIIQKLIGNHVTSDKYLAADTSHADGTQSDILYLPTSAPSEHFPPILVEVQRTVNPKFMARAVKYCVSVFAEHGVLPILLIICVDGFSSVGLCDRFARSEKPYLLQGSGLFWAKHCYLLSKVSIADFLDQTPMTDLVALGHFFSQKERSILSLGDKANDPTIRLLYQIAKEKLESERTVDETKLELMLTFCSQTAAVFQNIAASAEAATPQVSAVITAHVQDGLKLLEQQKTECKRLFQTAATTVADANTAATPTMSMNEDMTFVQRFMETRQGPMRWKQCYLDGVAVNRFNKYRNSSTLKTAYYKKRRQMKMMQTQ
ncbi:hypothetical protein Unana1_03671 [Umbelopsis nana]